MDFHRDAEKKKDEEKLEELIKGKDLHKIRAHYQYMQRRAIEEKEGDPKDLVKSPWAQLKPQDGDSWGFKPEKSRGEMIRDTPSVVLRGGLPKPTNKQEIEDSLDMVRHALIMDPVLDCLIRSR